VKALDAAFFDRPAEKAAYDLIGCRLHWENGEQSDSRIITETEAYIGRLTKALGITGELNGQTAPPSTGVWFSDSPRPPRRQIMRSARIGVDYAGSVWALKPYRFKLDHN